MSADVLTPHPYQPSPSPLSALGAYCAECLALPSDPTFTEHHAMPAGWPDHDATCYLLGAHLANIPAGAQDDADRVRDRHSEARAGAAYMRRHTVPMGPHDLAEMVRRNRRDAYARLARSQQRASPARVCPNCGSDQYDCRSGGCDD